MNGVNGLFFGNGNDARNIEIGTDRFAWLAHAIGRIGLEPMQSEAVFMGVNGHRSDAEFVSRPKDANGNFATVGNEQSAERF